MIRADISSPLSSLSQRYRFSCPYVAARRRRFISSPLFVSLAQEHQRSLRTRDVSQPPSREITFFLSFFFLVVCVERPARVTVAESGMNLSISLSFERDVRLDSKRKRSIDVVSHIVRILAIFFVDNLLSPSPRIRTYYIRVRKIDPRHLSP